LEVESSAASSAALKMTNTVGSWGWFADDAADRIVLYDYTAGAPRLRVNATALNLISALDLNVYSDDEVTLKFTVDGATGDTTWASAATTELGAYVYTWPLAGAVTGESLIATVAGAAITLSWAAPTPAAHTHDHDSELTNVSADDHHAQQHDVVGADHTLTGAQWSLVGATALNTIGLLTPSSGPGAAEAVLKTDASGYLTLVRLQITNASTYLTAAGGVVTDQAKIKWGPSSANELELEQGAVYPTGTGATDLGKTALRFKDLYLTSQLISSLATGTKPLNVTSITKCDNLNADFLDGYHGNVASVADTYVLRNADKDIAVQDVNANGTLSGSAANITNDISVGGTVDGVDIAAFKLAYDAHGHSYSKATSTGDFTTGAYKASFPVYAAGYPDTSTIVGYVHGVSHWHNNADSAWTYAATNSGGPTAP